MVLRYMAQLWVELCPSKRYTEVLTPGIDEVNKDVGNRDAADVIDLRWGHSAGS